MRRWGTAILVVALAISTVAVLGLAARRIMDRRRTTAEIERLRDALYRARVASDRCRRSLAASEASLLSLGTTIDSMRSRIDSFEALGGGRVPGEHYDEYLELFDAYNDSAAAWQTRSERLRTAEASCRSNIEEHNALSDSIQSILGDLEEG